MSSRRSSRTLRRRCRFFHAFVRSTTQRCRPSRCFDSMPGRAMRAAMPRRRSSCRFFREEYALSACSLAGRWRGGPRGCFTSGMASTRGNNSWVS